MKSVVLLGSLMLLLQLAFCKSFLASPSRKALLTSSFLTSTQQRIPRSRASSVVLSLQNRNVTASEDEPLISDPGVVVADLLGLALAAQLLGLLDVLGDPSFYQSGGWFQPVTAKSVSMFPELIQRFSIMSSLYLGAAFGLGGFRAETFDSSPSVIFTALKSAAGFCVLRGLLAIAIPLLTNHDISLVETLRETYFVALAIAASRYITYTLFYRK
jgi:hypothetical protein